MLSDQDLILWENLKKTLKPLLKKTASEPTPFPKRLHVYAPPPRELLYTLDLHGLTVEDAYRVLRKFLTLHMRNQSKLITIITGKGSPAKEGLIHKEIQNWLDTPFFKEQILDYRWLNGGGALELHLKRGKK